MGKSKIGILGWKWIFHENRIFCKLPWLARRVATVSTRQASYTVTAFPVSRSCIVFSYFCFDLDFWVNIKVVDNYVKFLMALIFSFWVMLKMLKQNPFYYFKDYKHIYLIIYCYLLMIFGLNGFYPLPFGGLLVHPPVEKKLGDSPL